jgi:hypothetical protein
LSRTSRPRSRRAATCPRCWAAQPARPG